MNRGEDRNENLSEAKNLPRNHLESPITPDDPPGSEASRLVKNGKGTVGSVRRANPVAHRVTIRRRLHLTEWSYAWTLPVSRRFFAL